LEGFCAATSISATGKLIMTILVFGEGSTEKEVCNGIAKRIGFQLQYISPGGKGQLNATAINRIRPLLEEGEPVLCVILYDLDSHENKTEASILQSISGEGGLKKIDSFRAIDIRSAIIQHSTHTNLHTISISMPDFNFHLAIHIATKKWSEDFIKSTIDDYVLELALRRETVNKLAKKISIPPERIFAKITQELPDLLKTNANGMNDLVEAKDYVRLYAAVLKLHTSPAVFAEKVMANADEQDIREVFGALIAAFEFVGGE
jgi:hypothetical protein